MKHFIFIIYFFSFCSITLIAQDYGELMQKQMETLMEKSSCKIIVDQKVYREEKLNENLSFRSIVYAQKGKIFWDSPAMKMIQHEKGWMMINEDQKTIFYHPLKNELKTQEVLSEGFAQWQEALGQYINTAISIKKTEEDNQWLFTILTSNPIAKEAKVRFSKSSQMMIGMELIQQLNEEEGHRLVYNFNYEFDTVFSNVFDEKKYINTTDQLTGIGRYADYQVLSQTRRVIDSFLTRDTPIHF